MFLTQVDDRGDVSYRVALTSLPIGYFYVLKISAANLYDEKLLAGC
jgi:hypothetical protein